MKNDVNSKRSVEVKRDMNHLTGWLCWILNCVKTSETAKPSDCLKHHYYRVTLYQTFCAYRGHTTTFEAGRIEFGKVFGMIMSHSGEFWKGVIVVIVICLMLSAAMRGENQQRSAAIAKNRPQEHDEMCSSRIQPTGSRSSWLAFGFVTSAIASDKSLWNIL